jgi:hypothetical protein
MQSVIYKQTGRFNAAPAEGQTLDASGQLLEANSVTTGAREAQEFWDWRYARARYHGLTQLPGARMGRLRLGNIQALETLLLRPRHFFFPLAFTRA